MDLLTQYKNDLDKVIPKIAEKHGLDMVVVEEAVQYSSEWRETKDVTGKLIEGLSEQATSKHVNPFFAPGSE